MNELTTTPQTAVSSPGETIGAVANRVAASHVFADYLSRKAHNTIRTHAAALDLFADYLAHVGITAVRLQSSPNGWHGITWGVVEGFKGYLLKAGHSIASVNNRLSIIKTYAGLATKAGAIAAHELVMIKSVAGYSSKEGKRVDEKRPLDRIGHKKAEHISLDKKAARRLKRQPATTVGARDSLMMCILLDHGLRCSEVAGLLIENIDIERGFFTFYRPKVDKWQTHKMTAATKRAAAAYLEAMPRRNGRLLVGSHRDSGLTDKPMSDRAITKRVAWLGIPLGFSREKIIWKTRRNGERYQAAVIVGTLSAHDCRHYWATDAARNGTDAFRLRDAGGWASLAMPSRYVEAATIANQGVVLSGD